VKTFNKAHMEVARDVIYSLKDDEEIKREQNEKYIKEHYKKVAMPHHELQEKILRELQENKQITLDYIQYKYN